jgi:D-alanyl-D-alanine carboxypeptidase
MVRNALRAHVSEWPLATLAVPIIYPLSARCMILVEECDMLPRCTPYRKRRVCAAAGIFLLFSVGFSGAVELYGVPPPNINAYLDRLVRSYPDWIESHDNEYVVLKSGTKFAISNHRTNKSFTDLLEHPDIDDMFYAGYPAGTLPKQPLENFDPGRVRYEPLFLAMYGDCRKDEVSKKLRSIEWLPAHGGGRVAITTVNGVDKALSAVSRELDELPTSFLKFLSPTSGTYNCRTVAGSRVISAHAWGAALDLNARYSDYWRWSKDLKHPIWRNQIPMPIVQVFERHGFIWGGYWYHFDTMHFEYRPELLGVDASASAPPAQ